MRFEVSFRGHENVRSLHRTTIEVTREEDLSVRGDCIIGVGASAACSDIPDPMKKRMRDPGSRIRISIEVDGLEFAVEGRGDPGLDLSHGSDMVARTSGFSCPRTVAVRSDKAAASVPREMVRRLRDPSARGTMVIEV